MRCLALVSALLLGSIAHATGTLVIGTSEFPPFEYLDGERVAGSDTELVEAVVRRMDFTPRPVLMLWKRIEHEAAQGRIDIVFSMTWSAERATRYHFSDPISRSRDVFYKRRDRQFPEAELGEFSGLRIGTCADYQYAPEFMQLVEDGTLQAEILHGSDCDLRNLLKLAGGRIDLFICDTSVCDYYIRTRRADMPLLGMLDTIDRTIGEGRLFRVGCPRSNDPERDRRAMLLCERFNDALRAMPEAEKQAIRARYPHTR